MNSIKRVAPALAVALVIALVFGGLVNAPALAQTARQQFGWVIAKRLTVDTTAAIGGNTTIAGTLGATGNTTVGGTLGVTGKTSLAGALGVTGSMTGTGAAFSGQVSAGTDLVSTGKTNVGTFLVLVEGATQVLTADGTLTPVASYQPISSTADIGTSSVGSAPGGTLLRVVNVGAQTITFTDTGTLRLSGNIALGPYDSLLLMSAGTGQGWVQMGTSNN